MWYSHGYVAESGAAVDPIGGAPKAEIGPINVEPERALVEHHPHLGGGQQARGNAAG